MYKKLLKIFVLFLLLGVIFFLTAPLLLNRLPGISSFTMPLILVLQSYKHFCVTI